MSFLIECPCACCQDPKHSDSPDEDNNQAVSFQLLTEVSHPESLPLLRKQMTTASFGAEAGQYEIHAVVGQGCGGAAVISAAKHKPTGQLVAIRRTNLEYKGINLNEIQHEVLLTRQLSHKNLMPYYCTFISEKEVYAVMPYMAYGSASELLKYPFQEGMPELLVAHVLHDVLQAVEYLHKRGIIHRSIKASHVTISDKGQVYLSGLRYSCDLLHNGKLLKTMHHFVPSVIRNLNWLSPEILEQNLVGYNTRSDVYSVGITACEMANGAVPFSHMPPTQMLLEKLKGPTPLLLDVSTCHFIETADQQPGEVEQQLPGYFKERMYTEGFHQFVDICLQRDVLLRPSITQLLHHVFFKQCRRSNVSLIEMLHRWVPPAENVDQNQLNIGISYPKMDSVTDKLENISIEDEGWNF